MRGRGLFLKQLSGAWDMLLSDNDKKCIFGSCCGLFRRQSILASYQVSAFLAEVSSMVVQMSDNIFDEFVEIVQPFLPEELYGSIHDNLKKDDMVNDGSFDKSGFSVENLISKNAVVITPLSPRLSAKSSSAKRKEAEEKAEDAAEPVPKIRRTSKTRIISCAPGTSKAAGVSKAAGEGVKQKKRRVSLTIEGSSKRPRVMRGQEKFVDQRDQKQRQKCQLVNKLMMAVVKDYSNYLLKKKDSHQKKRMGESAVSDVFSNTHGPSSNKHRRFDVNDLVPSPVRAC
jgi:hypothetical protein